MKKAIQNLLLFGFFRLQPFVVFFIFECFFISFNADAQTLVWQEDFSGSSLNANVWTYDFGNGCDRNLCGWGNAELQNYTRRFENVRIENGNLVIEARRENMGSNAFTSGRVKTEGRLHFKYGTLEARIKIPNLADGLWPAFWTLGTVGGFWPNIGEIDIMEMGSQSARFASLINKQVSAATHWSNNGSQADAVGIANAAVNLNDDYHLYKLVWNAQSITMYLDGVSFFTMDISNPSLTNTEEFHNPHFLLLNMAVGGSYTGLLNASGITASMPAQMLIDYVRLYQQPGDVLYLATSGTPSGNFGIFTDATSVSDSLLMGTNATLNYWNNLSAISGAVSFEGSRVWAVRANAGNWFGMGLDNKYVNLSGYTNGALKFVFKSSYLGQCKIGLKTGDGDSWINFPSGSTQYGFIRDGSWHEVSIPLSAFSDSANGRYFDPYSVKSAFMFAGDAPGSTADFYFDNIHVSRNVITPSLGTFSVPSKYLGDSSFVLTPPTSNSSGSFSYQSSQPAMATISGNMVTITGIGTATITAVQAPSGNYGSASASTTFQVLMPVPATAAPIPPARNTADCISLFSNAYSNVSGIDWFPNWGQTTVVSDLLIAGNAAKKYENFNYQGVQFASVVNASSMSYLHLDIWTPNLSAFDVYLINTSPALVEQKVTLTPTLRGWNSFDIQLSQYATVALNNLTQMKLTGLPWSSGIVYLDNIYFWRPSNLPALSNFSVPSKTLGDASFTISAPTSNSQGSFTYSSSNLSVATISGNVITITGVGISVITATQAASGSYASGSITCNLVVKYPGPSVAAPIPPARTTSDYISIFSDSYQNTSGTDFNPYWNQTTVVSDFVIASNTMKYYENFNYQGIQLSGVVNASGMQNLHIDLWTPNISGFDLYLINTAPALVEQKVTLTPTLSGWNSFDIPLSQFPNVALNNITQFKLEARPYSTSVLYWDNLYFWKNSVLAAPVLSLTQPSCSSATGSIAVTSTITDLSFSIDSVNYSNITGVFSGLNPGTYQVRARTLSGQISAPTTAVLNPSPLMPATPAAISGISNINQCDTLQSYAIPPVTRLSYVWSVSGTGNAVISGQGTAGAILKMKVAGTISVKASNSCGLSAASSLAVIKSVPATPVTVTSSGVNVCGFTNSAFFYTGVKDTFRVKRVVNCTGYLWEVPAGATFDRINDTAIAVLFPDTITVTSLSPKYVKVYGISACDTGLAKSTTLTRTLAAAPVAIQKSFVPSVTAITNVAGIDSSEYLIRKVSGAISYNWIMKNGSKAIIRHLNPAGPSDTSVRVIFAAGFSKDTLLVYSGNGCGQSTARSVILSAMALPPAPASITGVNNPCIGQILMYKANPGTVTSALAPTSRFRWTLPSLTTITMMSANADSSEIFLRFNAGFTGGTLSVKAVSAVGVVSAAAASVAFKYASATPTSIQSSTGSVNYCIGNRDTFKVVMPVLTATQASPVLFRWTRPSNTSFVYSNADSSVVVLSFLTGYNGGTLSVKSQTSCGITGIPRTLALTHSGCPSGQKPIAYVDTDYSVNFDVYGFNLSPNPGNGTFTLTSKKEIPANQDVTIDILDAYGNQKMQVGYQSAAGKMTRWIDASSLAGGLYYVRIRQGQYTNILKLMVMH